MNDDRPRPDAGAPQAGGGGECSSEVQQRDRLLLAPYAMHSAASRGRQYPEPQHPYRGPFQRDRDRIVHSSAYRRLSAKTQVFTGETGDYHRTRLTHTIEVASIARTIARVLRLNEDSSKLWHWRTTWGIRRSATPGKTRSIAAWPPTGASTTIATACASSPRWNSATAHFPA